MNLKSGDIFFVMHHDNRLSRLFAWFMKSRWSHTGLIFDVTDDARRVYTLETSDFEVTHQEFYDYLKDPNVSLEVWRFTNLNDDEVGEILDAANSVRGRVYGYLQLLSLAVRDIGKRFHINIPNFLKIGVICCDVILYGYGKSKIKELNIDPRSIETEDLYKIISSNANALKIMEK